MNIATNDAGSVSHEHLLDKGFIVFETLEGNDMGQMSWEIPQYKNDKCFITGGYWEWIVKDTKGKVLFIGWWNSNEEFDKTMQELELL